MIELLPSGKSEGYEVCADDVALAVISPVAARNRAQAGVGCQGGFAPPCAAALPLTACPGYAFSPASGGGISSRAAPFSKIGKGRGKKVDPLHYIKTEVFKMKRPLAYITAAWSGDPCEATEQAAKYCRAVYEAGFSPICPMLYQPLFLNDAVPEEHKSGIDMGRDLLRRSHVLVVCGSISTESMKNDVAVAQRLGITATTLDGILTVKRQGRR